jgi:predicted RNA-binding Zn ribbon-like protein
MVDGVPLPQLVADHPALELCNTVAGWQLDEPFDYLVGYEHLARLVGHLGLLDAAAVAGLVAAGAESPAAASQVLRRARELRAATYAVVTGTPTESDWDVLGRAVRASLAAGGLRPGGAALATWQHDPDEVGLVTPLHLLAWQVNELLTASPAVSVGCCPGHDCGWVFVNRGNRRWCVMATCGNREKARRHAARRPH